MKVFISWSGTTSHKVGLVFREWLPSVIQSIEPYVSSEDIDKGARWSTDIAKELEDSTFGILCVTRENIEAPWLSFEAGALSKTMDKTYVSPFLFDIKRSEVNGPILQFQSTIFQKDDIKKLVNTLNMANSEGCIAEERLSKAFEVWYPTLEEELNKLKEKSEEEVREEDEEKDENGYDSEILEEILDLSRDNQKLLRNPDTKLEDKVSVLNENIEKVMRGYERILYSKEKRRMKKYSPMYQEEFLNMVFNNCSKAYGFLIVLSSYKEDFPWIYDMGKELFDILKSDLDESMKSTAIKDFGNLCDITFHHPVMREMNEYKKENMKYLRELPYFAKKMVEDFQP